MLLGALTVLMAYFATRQVTSDPWTPVVAAALVAFMPHFLFLSAFVTNDNLAEFLGSVLLVAALRYAAEPRPWRMAWVGGTMGLLIATKLSTLPLAVVFVLPVLWSSTWARRAGHLSVGIAAAWVAGGWYLVQNAIRYGEPLALSASSTYLAKVGGLGTFFGAPYVVHNPIALVFWQVPKRFVQSFWYQSDWAAFRWPLLFNIFFFLVTVAALVGLFRSPAPKRALLVLALIVVASVASVWVTAFNTATYEAKYAMVGLSSMAALASLGIERWPVGWRFALPAMGLCGIGASIGFDVLAVHWS